MIGKAGDVVDQYAAKLHGRRVIFICEGTAYLLTSHDGHETVLNLYKKKLTHASYCVSIMQGPETTVLFESGVAIQMFSLSLTHVTMFGINCKVIVCIIT